MVVQMLFGKRDVLERYSITAAVELNEFIYPYPTHLYRGLFRKMQANLGPAHIKVSGRLTPAILPPISSSRHKALRGV